jgi:hypothetical protein
MMSLSVVLRSAATTLARWKSSSGSSIVVFILRIYGKMGILASTKLQDLRIAVYRSLVREVPAVSSLWGVVTDEDLLSCDCKQLDVRQ